MHKEDGIQIGQVISASRFNAERMGSACLHEFQYKIVSLALKISGRLPIPRAGQNSQAS